MGNITHGRRCGLAEVADALGIKATTAQSIEQRALKKCRAYLSERGIAISDLIDDAAMPIDLDTTHAESRFDAAAEQETMTC